MMHFNKEVDYGLLLLTSLAEAKGDNCISLSDIAKKKNLPYRFLGKIVTPLKKAGIVDSIKGVNGGYKLARSVQSIYLSEVLSAYEEDYAPVKCLKKEDNACQSKPVCGTKDFWKELHHKMAEVIDKYTVSDYIGHSNC